MTSTDKEKIAIKMKEEIELTGIEVAQVSIKIQSKKAKMPPSTFVVQAMSQLISMRLGNSSCRVLFFLLSQSAFANYVSIDIKAMSELMNLSRRSIIDAIKLLEVEGILVKIKNTMDLRRNDYFINPLVAWKGKSLERNKQISELALVDGCSNLLGLPLSTQIKNQRKK